MLSTTFLASLGARAGCDAWSNVLQTFIWCAQHLCNSFESISAPFWCQREKIVGNVVFQGASKILDILQNYGKSAKISVSPDRFKCILWSHDQLWKCPPGLAKQVWKLYTLNNGISDSEGKKSRTMWKLPKIYWFLRIYFAWRAPGARASLIFGARMIVLILSFIILRSREIWMDGSISSEPGKKLPICVVNLWRDSYPQKKRTRTVTADPLLSFWSLRFNICRFWRLWFFSWSNLERSTFSKKKWSVIYHFFF